MWSQRPLTERMNRLGRKRKSRREKRKEKKEEKKRQNTYVPRRKRNAVDEKFGGWYIGRRSVIILK